MTSFIPKKKRLRTAAFSAVLILLTLIISLSASFIPSWISKLDITSNRMNSLGDISKDIASSVSTDVTLYLVASESTYNETIKLILERYTAVNPKIKVELADPDKDATLIKSYCGGIPADNSIIAVSEKRSRYILYSELFSYSAETYSGCYQLYMAYVQAGYLSSSEYDFATFMSELAPELRIYDGFNYELQISSAIKYVSSDDVKNLYLLLGHSESLTEDIVYRLNLNLYDFQGVDLSSDELPDDTDCIMLMPSTDITESEYDILSSYLSDGGKLFLITSYSTKDFTNLLRLTSEYGLTTEFDKYLCEDDENYNYMEYCAYAVPDISDKATADILEESGASIMFASATGITSSEKDGITLTPILTTSPNAYTKEPGEDIASLAFNEDTDTRQSYYVGIKAENSNDGELVWISSGALIYDDYDPYTLRGNKLMFTSLMNSLNDFEGAPSIEPTAPSNTVIQPGASYIYTFIAIFILLAAANIVLCVIRCKKR